MDTATLIVAALVAGLAAGATSVAEQAIKDAYAGLKALILRKYGALGTCIDYLEADPDKKTRQESVAEDLRGTDAVKDAEILDQARALTEAVQTLSQDVEQQRKASFIIEGLSAARVTLRDIDIRGPNPEFAIRDATIGDSLDVEGVNVWEPNPKN